MTPIIVFETIDGLFVAVYNFVETGHDTVPRRIRTVRMQFDILFIHGLFAEKNIAGYE